MSTNGTSRGESPHDLRLSRFERNRFYHGKLMTARDMFAEQAYHVDRLDTFAKYLAGEGIAEGLGVRVVQEDTGDLTATVSAGVAIDCHGRLVVVEDEDDYTVEASAIFDDGGGPSVRLYIEYDECVKETVPLSGSESACEEACEYNRVLEIVRVVGRETLPEAYKRIPQVNFPDETAVNADAQAAMVGIAASFHANGGTRRECTDGREAVFLGTYREGLGPADEWGRDEADERGYAYTLDLLFAAVARHATRFDNPHAVTAAETGALRSVNEQANPGPEGSGNVNIVSPDGSITVDTTPGNPAAGDDPEVTLVVAEADAAENDHLVRYVLDKSLKYKAEVFGDVADRFWEARDVATAIVEAVDEGLRREPEDAPFADVERYRAFLQETFEFADVDDATILELEREVAVELNGVATTDSWERYDSALDTLKGLVNAGDADPLEVAVAQDYTAETAGWLERELTCVDFAEEDLGGRDSGASVGDVTFETPTEFVDPSAGVFPVDPVRPVGVANGSGNPQAPIRFSLPETSYVEVTMMDRNPDEWEIEEMRASQYALVGYDGGENPLDGATSGNAPDQGAVYTLRLEDEAGRIETVDVRDILTQPGREGDADGLVLEICYQV
jgi:hypothetical protein